MTLREIGAGFSDWLSTSLHTMQTQSLPDWPSVFALIGIAASIVASVIGIRIIVGFFMLMSGFVHEERNSKQHFQAVELLKTGKREGVWIDQGLPTLGTSCSHHGCGASTGLSTLHRSGRPSTGRWLSRTRSARCGPPVIERLGRRSVADSTFPVGTAQIGPIINCESQVISASVSRKREKISPCELIRSLE